MKVKVHLESEQSGNANVTVLLDASVSESFVFDYPATAEVIDKEKPIGTSVPDFLTYEAVEAGFRSGAIYARRRVGANALNVKLISFSWDGPIQNPIPFAVAATVGIYEAIANIRNYTAADLSGWRVVSVAKV